MACGIVKQQKDEAIDKNTSTVTNNKTQVVREIHKNVHMFAVWCCAHFQTFSQLRGFLVVVGGCAWLLMVSRSCGLLWVVVGGQWYLVVVVCGR